MSRPVIALLQGDGVGPEVLAQALETLNVLCSASITSEQDLY